MFCVIVFAGGVWLQQFQCPGIQRVQFTPAAAAFLLRLPDGPKPAAQFIQPDSMGRPEPFDEGSL